MKQIQLPIKISIFISIMTLSQNVFSQLQDDFSNPAAWIITNGAGNSDNWVIGTTSPSGNFPIAPIVSNTAANGFALFDSDLLCSGSQLGYLSTAESIDCSTMATVGVRFESFYRKFQGNTILAISTDNTNWTNFDLFTALGGGQSTSNPAIEIIDISTIAAGESTVWIRFIYSGGCDYAWMIDDVSVDELAALGLESFNNTLKHLIYPNPASDFITISGLRNKENFRVYDVLGTEILKGVILNNEEILIKDFPNGLYFLKFDNGNTIKFIKK